MLPSASQLYQVLENTWPAATQKRIGPWDIRIGQGGGQRVSATTAVGAFNADDISTAEIEMNKLGQPNLFMIRQDDAELDRALAERGYRIKDPVALYACSVEILIDKAPPPVSGFTIWPPLQIMQNIWLEGGIGAGRLDVMARVSGPRTGILARVAGRAAGSGFVAVHNDIAMFHAIEVLPSLRRKGAGINMMRTAAIWAQDVGAEYFSLVVTDANLGANTLYRGIGMTEVGKYHYRIKEK